MYYIGDCDWPHDPFGGLPRRGSEFEGHYSVIQEDEQSSVMPIGGLPRCFQFTAYGAQEAVTAYYWQLENISFLAC
jgi:hypothetical protein